jgi:pyruvate kinase
MPASTDRGSLRDLRERLAKLDDAVRRGERERMAGWHARVAGTDYALSAANLAAYLAFRQHDVRDVQDALATLGLSSLGRLEANVRAGIASVRVALDALLGEETAPERLERLGVLRATQRRLLAERAAALLGPEPAGRFTRIMVTLPGEAASGGDLIDRLVASGMDVARINAAHDDPATWRELARRVRAAAATAGRPCRVLVDLPGPKLRIASLPGQRARLRLRKVSAGQPASLLALDGSGRPGTVVPDDESGMPFVAVDPDWLLGLGEGDEVACTDARGRDRVLRVDARTSAGQVILATSSGVALEEGTRLIHRAADGTLRPTPVGPFLPAPGSVEVGVGDRLRLTGGPAPAGGWADVPGAAEVPAIACPEPAVLEALRPGHRVVIDDGHVVTVVESVAAGEALLRVAATRRSRERLRSDEGLNFPDTPILLRGTHADDLAALDVATEVADLVGLSFAQEAADIDRLIEALEERSAAHVGIVAKVETHRGVVNLPDIIVAGASRRPFGVMIARGDLAVEIGYERLAEMQEELLWLCEAAHVPVVWATQVLESLVKTGIPTRAELTDAAMADRAECVMLNKGPFILEGMRTLHDVIVRMETHQDKKTPLLRALTSW